MDQANQASQGHACKIGPQSLRERADDPVHLAIHHCYQDVERALGLLAAFGCDLPIEEHRRIGQALESALQQVDYLAAKLYPDV